MGWVLAYKFSCVDCEGLLGAGWSLYVGGFMELPPGKGVEHPSDVPVFLGSLSDDG